MTQTKCFASLEDFDEFHAGQLMNVLQAAPLDHNVTLEMAQDLAEEGEEGSKKVFSKVDILNESHLSGKSTSQISSQSLQNSTGS